MINQTKYRGWCRSLAVGLVLAVGIVLFAEVAVAQDRRLGPQPDGSRVIRWPKGVSGELSAVSCSKLSRYTSSGEAQLQALRHDWAGLGSLCYETKTLSGAGCYVLGAGATWQDDVAAQSRDYRVVPPDSRLQLVLSPPARGSLNPAFLSQLAPGDLYALEFSPYSAPGKVGPRPGDAIMPHITRLTGLKCLDLLHTNVTTRGLRQLTKIKGLERLRVPLGITEEGLVELARLPNLKSVGGLYDVTDRGLEILAGIPTLEELETASPLITDAGLAHLAKLPRLRLLQLWPEDCEGITDAGMVHLARISSLKALNLSFLNITDAGLAELARLPNLEGLGLFDTLVTDEGVVRLKSLRSLKTLNFYSGPMGHRNRVQVTEQAVPDLAEIRSLEYLTTTYSDETLPYLCTLPSIKRLSVHSDAAMVRISRVQSLEFVGVSGDISPASLAYLTRLKNLQKLRLGLGTHCGEYLAQVARLKSLKSLQLMGDSQLTVSDLKQLNPLANLVYLSVTASLKQDETGLDLSGLTALEELYFSSYATQLTDRDLAGISKLPKLRRLTIPCNGLTDGAKAQLARSPSLKWCVGVDLHVIRTGQPDPWLEGLRAGASKTSAKPQAQQRKRR